MSNSGDCATAFPCALGDIPPKTSRVVTSVFQASSGSAASASVTVSSPSNFNPLNDSAAVAINGSSGPKASASNGGCSSTGDASLPALRRTVPVSGPKPELEARASRRASSSRRWPRWSTTRPRESGRRCPVASARSAHRLNRAAGSIPGPTSRRCFSPRWGPGRSSPRSRVDYFTVASLAAFGAAGAPEAWGCILCPFLRPASVAD